MTDQERAQLIADAYGAKSVLIINCGERDVVKQKKRKAILDMRFSQGRYSRVGYGNAVIKLSCGHEVIRSWNKRPKGCEMKCDYC